MIFPSVLSLILLGFASSPLVESKNILFFQLVGSVSHRSSMWPLAAGLADAGHNVTYIFPFRRRPGSHPGVEEWVASKLVASTEAFSEKCEINLRLNNTIKQFMFDNMLRVPQFCADFYDSPETQAILGQPDRKFDLIILNGAMGQCGYGLVHHFKAKHIIFHPLMVSFLYDSFGLVPETSSIPDFLFHPTASELRTSLWSRTLNTMSPFIWRASYLYCTGQAEAVVKDRMKIYETSSSGSMPSFEEMEQETSLVLHNSYFVEDYPISLPPLFVSYSGLSCSEKERSSRKPLPTDLESFVNDPASTGFVYISFGTAVHVHTMPVDLRDQFMSMFRAFPNLKFLWKWNGPVPEGTPKNALLQPWFPQADVLAHPKVKGFMTQVGRPSAQEAMCYGVPMIAVPMFADQDQNAQRLIDHGVAVRLNLETLSTETMITAIREITEKESYRNAALQLSTMYRDRPMDPLENILYWVEYVLKYNTTLMQPLSMKQAWWQRRLLDVYAVLMGILLVILCVLSFVGYLIVKCIAGLCKSSESVPGVGANKKRN